MGLRNQLDKIGIGGATVSALCCLGVTTAVSVMASLGLGFLVNDNVLMPLLLVFLALAVAGLGFDARKHHHRSALILGTLGGLGLAAFTFVAPAKPGAYLAIAAMVAASGWNVYLRKHPA